MDETPDLMAGLNGLRAKGHLPPKDLLVAQLFTATDLNGKNYGWAIDPILEWAKGKSPTTEVPVDQWWERFGGNSDIDHEYAMSLPVSPDRPVLAVRLDDGTNLVIDGLHRLYAAFRRNRKTYPAIMVPPEVESQCRLPVRLIRDLQR